jgi:predicted DNA-binding transcriptional regulator AlpA
VGEWRLSGPDAAVLTKREVVDFLKLRGPRTLDRLIEAGQFPRGRKVGKRGLIWTGADVAAFLQLQGRLTAGPADVAEEDEDDGD